MAIAITMLQRLRRRNAARFPELGGRRNRRSSGSRLIWRIELRRLSTKLSKPSTRKFTSAPRPSSRLKVSLNKRSSRPNSVDALLSLALDKPHGAAPFKVAQVDVVTEGGAMNGAAA